MHASKVLQNFYNYFVTLNKNPHNKISQKLVNNLAWITIYNLVYYNIFTG